MIVPPFYKELPIEEKLSVTPESNVCMPYALAVGLETVDVSTLKSLQSPCR